MKAIRKKELIAKIKKWVVELEKFVEKSEKNPKQLTDGIITGNAIHSKGLTDEAKNAMYKDLHGYFKDVSDKDLKDLVGDLLSDKLFNQAKFNDNVIGKRIEKLEKESKVKRECCMPVHGLLIKKELQIGRAFFYPEEFGKRNNSTMEAIFRNFYKWEMYKRNYGWVCVKLNGARCHAELSSKNIASDHVKVLEYLYHNMEGDYSSGGFVDISYALVAWEVDVPLSRKEGGRFTESLVVKSNGGFELKKGMISRMKRKSIFSKFDLILKDDNKLSRKILVAIDFYHESLIEKRNGLQIMKIVIGIESLLQTRGDVNDHRIGANLSEKIAFLLSNKLEERLQIIDDVKNIYNTRSTVVHEGKEDVIDVSDILRAREYLGRIIEAFVKKYKKEGGFNSIDDIDRWYKNKKMRNR